MSMSLHDGCSFITGTLYVTSKYFLIEGVVVLRYPSKTGFTLHVFSFLFSNHLVWMSIMI